MKTEYMEFETSALLCGQPKCQISGICVCKNNLTLNSQLEFGKEISPITVCALLNISNKITLFRRLKDMI